MTKQQERTALDDYTEFIKKFYMCTKCNTTIPDMEKLKDHLEDEHDKYIGFKQK